MISITQKRYGNIMTLSYSFNYPNHRACVSIYIYMHTLISFIYNQLLYTFRNFLYFIPTDNLYQRFMYGSSKSSRSFSVSLTKSPVSPSYSLMSPVGYSFQFSCSNVQLLLTEL